MLRGLGFSLQPNAKVPEGRQHEDRDAQFDYLNQRVSEHIAAGQPVISVDTKKKELVGAFKNGRREYQPTGTPAPTNVHDFMDKELVKAIPYGVYDVATNTGWVSVGTDHNTAAFAVATLRRWWDTIGHRRYPHADRLLICADVAAPTATGSAPGRPNWPASPPKPGWPSPSAISPGHHQMEQDRTPAVLPDHHGLARPAAAQPPHDHRPDQEHHHYHRADRPLCPGHRPVPHRHQVHGRRR
jgi:hypothetical protein